MKKIVLMFLTIACTVLGGVPLAVAESMDEQEKSFREQIAIDVDLLELQPDNADVYFRLGNTHYDLAGHLKERGSWFLQTRKKASDSEEADRLYDEAIKHWKEAVRIQPRHAGAHFNLGVNFFIKEKKVAAIYHMRRADQLFMETGNTDGLEKSKKALGEWYERFGYKPEDFVAAK